MRSIQSLDLSVLKQTICEEAVRNANMRARKEILLNPILAPLLAQISPVNISILKDFWSPFSTVEGNSENYIIRLLIEEDWLARAVMTHIEIYSQMQEIAKEAFQETFVDNDSFITILLTDLIVGD